MNPFLRALAALAVAFPLQAGLVQGVVLEHVSGRPLARTIVRLDRIGQLGAARPQPIVTRTAKAGTFTFQGVPSGMYILTALHAGYFPAAFGQRVPSGRGTPVEVTAESKLFAEIRARHMGAITGRVLDENGVGTAGVTVVAYRARLPLRSAGSALSDDRGIYRIAGLEPGKYWVRSGSHVFDDRSGWLPTFGPQAPETALARVHQVAVDADTPDADVTPDPGSVFHLGGVVACAAGLVTVTLSSETGRRTIESGCLAKYNFEGLAPGHYQVLATLHDGTAAGFLEFSVSGDFDGANVVLMPLSAVQIETRRPGAEAVGNIPIKLLARRQDFSETDAEREVKPGTLLTPGYWEIRAEVSPGSYTESITNVYTSRRHTLKPDESSDWFEIFVEPRSPSRIRVIVSGQTGQITGRVVAEGKAAAGAPIFLWPAAESARKSLGGALETLADIDGHFGFDSLPPGDYRLLATFDVYEIDGEAMQMSNAPTVHVDASQTANAELPLWIAPW